MARNSASVKLTGIKELETALLKLSPELARIVEADVLREGMKPVRKAAQGRAAAISDTGLLAKSIGLNVRRIRRKLQYQNRYTARVGARTGFRTTVTRKGKKKPEIADPSKYAHLVEFGTSHSPAKPVIVPALLESEGAIMDAMARGYDKGMTKVIRKIRSRK